MRRRWASNWEPWNINLHRGELNWCPLLRMDWPRSQKVIWPMLRGNMNLNEICLRPIKNFMKLCSDIDTREEIMGIKPSLGTVQAWKSLHPPFRMFHPLSTPHITKSHHTNYTTSTSPHHTIAQQNKTTEPEHPTLQPEQFEIQMQSPRD